MAVLPKTRIRIALVTAVALGAGFAATLAQSAGAAELEPITTSFYTAENDCKTEGDKDTQLGTILQYECRKSFQLIETLTVKEDTGELGERTQTVLKDYPTKEECESAGNTAIENDKDQNLDTGPKVTGYTCNEGFRLFVELNPNYQPSSPPEGDVPADN